MDQTDDLSLLFRCHAQYIKTFFVSDEEWNHDVTTSKSNHFTYNLSLSNLELCNVLAQVRFATWCASCLRVPERLKTEDLKESGNFGNISNLGEGIAQRLVPHPEIKLWHQQPKICKSRYQIFLALLNFLYPVPNILSEIIDKNVWFVICTCEKNPCKLEDSQSIESIMNTLSFQHPKLLL